MDATISTYDNMAPGFAAATWEIYLESAMDSFAAHLLPGARILDLGCGPGRDVAHFHRRGFQAAGADLSSGMLQEARRRIDGILIQCDMRRLPVADASLDGIWLCASLLHLPRFQAFDALLEVRRVMHPGAPLFVSVQRGEGETWKTRGGPRLFAYYQPDELGNLVKRAGFNVDTSWEACTEHATWINLVALAV